MKPFDEKFGENVREVFDNYREPVDERAWKQMKSRLKARSGKRIFGMAPLFMRTAAAITFLILTSGSIWLLVLNQRKPGMATAYEVHEESPAFAEDAPGDTPSGSAVEEDIMHEVNPGHDGSIDQAGVERPSLASVISERPDEDEIIAQTVTGEGISTGETERTRETGLIRETVSSGETPGVQEIADNRYIAGTPLAPDTREIPDTPPPAELHPLSAISGIHSRGVTSHLVPSEQPAADADAFITSRNLESLGDAETGRDRASIVEVSAGSMKTWSSQEVAGGLGYTAGVGGDWRVGRRMSIHSGGLLVYNRFSLRNTLVSAKHHSYQEFAASPERDMNLVYNVLQYQTSDTDVEFTALDIPVNIRFTLKEAPGRRIFLSAGFSSFLYLQQKYSSESTVLASYHRLNPQGHYVSETDYANLTSGGEFSAFRRFDLARFLNLSGGYMIRGRNQSLIIEPFLKYPLGDVTTLNLNIGMAGLSLKYLPGSR